MGSFGWTVTVAGWLIIPIISLSYFRFRLAARREQLVNLFTIPGILQRYLFSRGRDVQALPGETEEAHLTRLRGTFDQVFEKEFGREYSQTHYFTSFLLGSVFSALVVFSLVRENLGPPVIPDPIKFALLGGLFWSIWSLVRGYSVTDLVPSTFYWVIFRYVLAVSLGLLANVLFAEPYANFGAFVFSTLPVGETIRFLRTRLSQFVPAATLQEGQPPLEKLQGMERTIMDKLEELGISTTQELAYLDPLALLFRTNIPPKVLIDWINQALLYNYVGDVLERLRVRGIRGAIDLAALFDGAEEAGNRANLLGHIAQALGIDVIELGNLIKNLYRDNQVQLVREILGWFDPPGPEPRPSTPPGEP
jgi:hypothetical protein